MGRMHASTGFVAQIRKSPLLALLRGVSKAQQSDALAVISEGGAELTNLKTHINQILKW